MIRRRNEKNGQLSVGFNIQIAMHDKFERFKRNEENIKMIRRREKSQRYGFITSEIGNVYLFCIWQMVGMRS